MTNPVCECLGYKVRDGSIFQPNCLERLELVHGELIAIDLGCVTKWTEVQLEEIGRRTIPDPMTLCEDGKGSRDFWICTDIIVNELTNRGWNKGQLRAFNDSLEVIHEERVMEYDRIIDESQTHHERLLSRLTSISGVSTNLAEWLIRSGAGESLGGVLQWCDGILHKGEYSEIYEEWFGIGIEDVQNIKNSVNSSSVFDLKEWNAIKQTRDMRRRVDSEFYQDRVGSSLQDWANLTGIPFEDLLQREREREAEIARKAEIVRKAEEVQRVERLAMISAMPDGPEKELMLKEFEEPTISLGDLFG